MIEQEPIIKSEKDFTKPLTPEEKLEIMAIFLKTSVEEIIEIAEEEEREKVKTDVTNPSLIDKGGGNVE